MITNIPCEYFLYHNLTYENFHWQVKFKFQNNTERKWESMPDGANTVMQTCIDSIDRQIINLCNPHILFVEISVSGFIDLFQF